MNKSLSCYFLFVALVGCTAKNNDSVLFELVKNSGIHFTNKVENNTDFNIFSYRNFYNGGGVGIGDINNDGLADVYLTANMGPNKLYLNKGDFKFEDISEKAGITEGEKWSTGVVMVDVNADGWLDIYVCNAGYQKGVRQENALFINNHDLTFTESAKAYGLADAGYSTHAAFFDYDLDGDLDCYILNNSFIPVNTLNYANKRDLRAEDWPVADFLKGGGDKLLRNDNGKFIDASKEAGIYGSLIGFGLGVTVGDVNGDRWPDLYISNDFFERDYLYINQKNGTFKEELEQRMKHTSLASMGADIGDINNDGYPEIFTTDMLPADDYRLKTTSLFDNIDVYKLKERNGFYHQFMQNTLQLNNQNGTFSDIAFYSGVSASDWSWGGLMFDADNDGYNDIYVCNGIQHDLTDQDFIDYFANDVIQKMVLTGKKEEIETIINKMPSTPIPNKAFKNGGNLKFSDAAASWGLDDPSFSNGAAYGDLDGDGDLDLVVNNLGQESFVYKNNSRQISQNNYISISLSANGKNTFAIGSSIQLYSGSQVIGREVIPSRGFQSSVDYKIVTGLGKKIIDSLKIIWPDHSVTLINKPVVNKHHRFVQPTGGIKFNLAPTIANSLFVASLQQPFMPHIEDDHVDFYYERGLFQMLSREGPKAAVGDVNSDGFKDVYIGGTSASSGRLYLGTKSGFVYKEQKAFAQSGYEDVAVLFFDADGDLDLDLFVGSGGNNGPANSFKMQNRLYKNDGKGSFTMALNALPLTGMNTSVVVENDIDGDGDADLFVGSRSVPQSYGVVPPSFLLVNDGTGNFSDETPALMPSGSGLGLITDAAWVDITGDAKKELVVVGEWMAPKVWAFSGGKFQQIKTALDTLHGLWRTVSAADLDGDGKEDLLFGNIGENFYLNPANETPVKMWVADFDNNGTKENIITRTVKGKDVPVFLKRELTDQVASLKKQNLRHDEFAKRSVQELFGPDGIKAAQTSLFNYCSSITAFNKGGGNFVVQKLPPQVQFSSVHKFMLKDINSDGKIDIITGGNAFYFQPQFSRLDASYGNVLINTGKGIFSVMPNSVSGISINGEVRDIADLSNGITTKLLFLQNNSQPVIYDLKK